jgi:hypothetical protein
MIINKRGCRISGLSIAIAQPIFMLFYSIFGASLLEIMLQGLKLAYFNKPL